MWWMVIKISLQCLQCRVEKYHNLVWSVSVLSLEGGEIVLNDALSCPDTPTDADFAVDHGAISGNPVLEILDFWFLLKVDRCCWVEILGLATWKALWAVSV